MQSLVTKVVAALVGFVAVCSPSVAWLVALESGSQLVLRSDDVPRAVRSGSYTCFLWLRPEAAHDVRRRVYAVPGAVKITLEPGSGVQALHLTSGGAATAPARLEPGRWGLVAVSWDARAGRLDVWAGSEGDELAHGVLTYVPSAPGLEPARPHDPPPEEPWSLGGAGGEPGMIGAYGLVVLRDHAIGEVDAREVWESRRLFAPYDHDNAAAGGRMTGWRGAEHMVGHAISTSPIDGGVGGSRATRGAVVGGAVEVKNVHILDWPSEPVGPYWFPFRTVRPIVSTSGFAYHSRLEPGHEGFFQRDVPDVHAPPTPVASLQSDLRMLVTGPDRPLRVIVSANSRGVRSSDHGPENYMHGFAELNLAQVSGVMLRSVSLSGTQRWLGYDVAPAASPIWSKVQRLDVTTEPRADFTRFFTATGVNARGGGSGVLIRPGGFHRLRCGPVEGSLLRAEAPLVTEAHLLRFPGSGDLLWQADRGASQSAPGQREGAVQRVSLDTTRMIHTMGSLDRLVDPHTLALAGDFSGMIEVGDACFIGAGPGAESISLVSSIDLAGGETVLTFEHPFGEAPGVASELRFGPWGFQTVRYEWEGVAAGDPDTWRGLELSCAESAPGVGVVAIAVSAHRKDVSGFIFGAVGWGGHGYDLQLDHNFSAATRAWMALSKADVWVQGFAQQGSQPEAMTRYADVIKEALPDAEILWAGEIEHGNSTFLTWHRYILDNAAARGIAAVSLLRDPGLGSYMEQLADGMRADTAHFSAFGNLVLAEHWTRQIDEATYCVRVDLDGDGALTAFDMLEFTALFAAGDSTADFDGDGELTFLDFLVFQTEFGECGG